MRGSKLWAMQAALVASWLGLQATAAAQLVAPRPVTQQQPPQPTNASGAEVGGWAIVRYSVLADGTTANVTVTDAVPPNMDTTAIAETAEQWRFDPGTSDGDRIDWYNNEALVAFLSPTDGQATPGFADAYNGIAAMIDANDLESALAASEVLINEQSVRTPELALALAQRAIISYGLGDAFRAYRLLRLATDPRVPTLAGQDLFYALQQRLRLETELGRTRDAIDTYERIASGLDPEAGDPFADVAEQLKSHWANTEYLQLSARIDDKPWEYAVGRRYFYFNDIEGEIDSLDIFCDTRHLEIDFQADADYQLPDAFGACTLFVEGEPGTTFSLVEVLPPSG